MARCIFHIDLDAFFVSVERLFDPELKGKPVIVGGDPERHGVVASASYEARPFGIHAGMPLSGARRLCPRAIFIPTHLPRYRDASVKFMGILADFSPCIEPMGLDEAYLDVTGCEEPYGSFHRMAVAIKGRIHEELKLTASVGIATCKVAAKVASDLCKPDGLLEVASGGESQFLRTLPVAKLPGVGKKMEQVLGGMGVITIGDFASLPSSVVKRRFRKFGEVVHRYASGIDDRRVEAPGESRSISKQTTFARDTLERYFLEISLHRLCEQVSAELRHRGKRTGCVTLKLRDADFETTSHQATLKEVSNVSQVIFTAALQLLNRALSQRRKPIRLIGVRVSGLSGEGRQLNMFDSRTERLERLDKAIDQIREKYGTESIRNAGSGLDPE